MPKTMRFPIFPWQHGYPPTWRGRYARLNQDEQNLMTWYLDLRRDAISELWYDVRTDGRPEHIQHQLPVDITDDPTMLRMWWHQNAKRIDAIALGGGTYRIIELHARAGAQTVGELVQYQTLARAQWPELMWTNTVLVTRAIDDATRRVLQDQHFTILLPSENLA